jgi:hypothetical protein
LERDFPLKRQLTVFIENHVSKMFSWANVQELFSWKHPLRSVERFHELLEGKKHLFFLFINPNRIVGSYFPSRYPRLTERNRHDKNSFLFVSEGENIVKYIPNEEEFQLSVNERLYVCHGNTPSYADGIRTFQRNFDSINYCLPSRSFKN